MAVNGDLTACMHVFLYFAAVAQVWHVTQDYYIQFLFLKLVQSSSQSCSLRTGDPFLVITSLPPKNGVCEPEEQNDFRDVKPFVLMLASQIKG